MFMLPASDAVQLSAIALARLCDLFPILHNSGLTITTDGVLWIDCPHRDDLTAIAADDGLMHFIYLTTGCNAAAFTLEGMPILTRTQLRLIQLSDGAVEMAATKTLKQVDPVFDVERMAKAIATAIYSELTHSLSPNGEAKMIAVEPTPPASPSPPASTAPTASTPSIRIPRGAFTPAKSNWMQSAKRYLRAIDPGGNGGEVLAAIVEKTPLGDAHLNKALSYLPKAEREAAREKFYLGFVKVDKERREK